MEARHVNLSGETQSDLNISRPSEQHTSVSQLNNRKLHSVLWETSQEYTVENFHCHIQVQVSEIHLRYQKAPCPKLIGDKTGTFLLEAAETGHNLVHKWRKVYCLVAGTLDITNFSQFCAFYSQTLYNQPQGHLVLAIVADFPRKSQTGACSYKEESGIGVPSYRRTE